MHTVPPAIDQYKRRTQQISTGLCFLLLVVSLAFPVYLSLLKVTKTIAIQSPSLSTYAQLYARQPELLTCSCSKPSIPYEQFIHIDYTMHQVCSSMFVTQDWISYLAMSTETKFPYDFRSTSSSSFQALAMLCNLIQTTIYNSLVQFYSNQYVSIFVMPFQLFQLQTQSMIMQFTLSTTNSFLLSLSMIQGTIQSNALFSGLQTNYKQEVQTANTSLSAQSYNNCTCASSSKCTFQSAIYKYPNVTSLFNVPGFYTGCYVIESLLQSNLQCFFNQTCINKLLTYLSASTSIQMTALNPLLASQYLINTSIQQLLDTLMVEQWNTSFMYDKYYYSCQPMQCTYSIETTNDVTYIATMWISVAGGLIAILSLIVPRTIRFIAHVVRKRVTRVIPNTAIA